MSQIPLLGVNPSGFIEASAVFDATRTYRYELLRRWAPGPSILWIMLNPSDADENDLDPSLTRVLDYSRRYGDGAGAFEIGNVYGFVSPYPEDLFSPAVEDPVGPFNHVHLEAMARRASKVVVGWGTEAKPQHVAPVVEILRRARKPMLCLSTNKDGSPGHPLYLRKTLTFKQCIAP